MTHLIDCIQRSLSPELLKGRWQFQSNPLQGHCYVASEALYHMLGKTDWKPMYASYFDKNGKASHWWLINRHTGEIADPTASQFYPNKPPYHLGKGSGFLTKEPSKRAKLLIKRTLDLL